MIAVIDYGMGNLRSVQKALEAVGGRAKVTSSPSGILGADKVVFPGVGAFRQAMDELRRRRLAGPITDAIASGKPFLGLCLGMQLLFDESEEGGASKGLGILRGAVRQFRLRRAARRLKVPHMGWNTIQIKNQISKRENKKESPSILRGVPDGSFMYFVHSYVVEPEDRSCVLTTTRYGGRFVSGVQRENICAFQFHPEKSQRLGLRILSNFVNLYNK